MGLLHSGPLTRANNLATLTIAGKCGQLKIEIFQVMEGISLVASCFLLFGCLGSVFAKKSEIFCILYLYLL